MPSPLEQYGGPAPQSLAVLHSNLAKCTDFAGIKSHIGWYEAARMLWNAHVHAGHGSLCKDVYCQLDRHEDRIASVILCLDRTVGRLAELERALEVQEVTET